MERVNTYEINTSSNIKIIRPSVRSDPLEYLTTLYLPIHLSMYVDTFVPFGALDKQQYSLWVGLRRCPLHVGIIFFSANILET